MHTFASAAFLEACRGSEKEQEGQQGTGTSLNTSASFTRAQESSPRLYPCGLDQIAYGFKVSLEDIFS